uniref:PiggyBac transposable element-derived protein domain-containing protein n=1 Tax=Graphocephala atropunctata TaxID=36148 RepID=A0A1B6MGI3_9HEMI
MSNFLEKGRTLFADNFYNNVPLAEFLLKKKTYLCGTLRKDRRGNPKEVVKKNTKKGEIAAKQNRNSVKVMNWRDKRRVLMISTQLVNAGRNNRNGTPVMKPKCVLAYNAAKKGVDISDQLSSYYSPLRKTTKWYKKVAVEIILGTCVVNYFVLFNSTKEKKDQWNLLKFRTQLAKSLVAIKPEEPENDAIAVQQEPHAAGNNFNRFPFFVFK